MDMKESIIFNELMNFQDKEYALFQAKLIPNIKENSVIGVRVPNLRKLAKQYNNSEESKMFMHKLPHEYYDENMLHACFLSLITNYDECIKEINLFLPFVDNWAVCDTIIPKVLKENRNKLIIQIKKWIKSKDTYTCRFGIKMLMSFYLDDDFDSCYLTLVSLIESEEYYINMMIAWFFATALAKQWDSTIRIIENKKLKLWVHNKTIQKACESYRITNEQKRYLKNLKI